MAAISEQTMPDDGLRDQLRRSEEALWNEINSLRHTIYGNGQEGLTVRLAVIQGQLSTMQRESDRRSKREWAIIMLLITIAVEVGLKYVLPA